MKSRRAIASILAAACSADLLISGAWADTAATYTGNYRGSWGTASNWSIDLVPINTGATTFAVTINSQTVVYNLLGTNQIDSLTMSQAAIDLNPGCNLSVLNGGALLNSTILATGASFYDTEAVSNLPSTSLGASGGGSITFSALTTYATNASPFSSFNASGTSSTISLPLLTTVNEEGTSLTLQASNGGNIQTPLLANVTYSGSVFEGLSISSSGTGSLVNVPLLGNNTLTRVNITVQSGGTLNWGSPTTIQDSSITLDTSGTLNTSALSNLTSSNIAATNGVTLSLPSLAAYATDSNQSGSFTASNASSKVSLPALSSIGEHGWNVSFSAQNGGDIEAPLLANVAYSGSVFEGLSISSSGAGSLVDVPLLGTNTLTRASITVQSGGTLNWGNPTTIQDSSITLDTSGTLNTSTLSNLDSTSVAATNGATMTFPALITLGTNYTEGAWTASNANSKLSLPALTNISEHGSNASFSAQNGGDIEAPLLTNVTYSGSVFENLSLSSSGAGSVVDVPLLGSVPQSELIVSVSNGGTINWGSPVTIQYSSITLNSSGTLNTSALSNLNCTSVTATNSATMSFPALVTLSSISACGVNWTTSAWTASNANSKLSLPALTNISEHGCNASFSAQNGGDIEAPLLANVTYSGSVFENLTLSSTGAGSVVDVPLLGSVPQSELNVSVSSGGTVNWGSPTTIQDSSITLDTSGTLNTSALSNLDSTRVTASNGASMSFPSLVILGTNSAGGTVWTSSAWTASNANSKLLLPALRIISEQYWNVAFTATNGGDIEAPLLSNVGYNGVSFENLFLSSSGAGSLIDVSLLGSIPQTLLDVSVSTGGTILWGSPVTIQNSSITLDTSGTLNISALSNLDSTSVTATNGATMTFPGLVALATNNLGGANWTASNANSMLSLPALTNISEHGWGVGFWANGGDVELPLLSGVSYSGSIFEGLTISSSGAGSVVDVPLLGSNPLTRLTVTVASGGAINWGSPTTIQDSKITLDGGGTLNTSSITNLDSTSLTATDGATLTFPAITTFATDSSTSATFTASKASSKLSLPALTAIHENRSHVSLEAQNGGYLDLHNLSLITGTGWMFEGLNVTSSNANSVVSLSSLTNTSSLSTAITLTDNGTILLGAAPGTTYLNFQAEFINSNGPLDVYLGSSLIDAIAPNHIGSNGSYKISVGSALASSQSAGFVAAGSNADVQMSNYEPTVVLTLIATGSATWCTCSNWDCVAAPNAKATTAVLANSIGGAAATVTVTAPATVGTIAFNNTMGGSYAIAGNSSLTIDDSGDFAGVVPTINVLAGSHSITAPLSLANGVTLNVLPSTSLTLGGSTAIAGTAKIAATGGGTVYVGDGILPASTSLSISNGATVALFTPAGYTLGSQSLASLAIDSTSTLDVGGKMVSVPDGIGGPFFRNYSAIHALIVSGYVNNGTGIITSLADDSDGVGLFDDGTTTTFGYALLGDANMTGSVGFADLVVLAQNYGTSGTHWQTGDFNYDGSTGFQDLVLLAQNYGTQASSEQDTQLDSINPAFAADWALAQQDVGAVPEPASLGLLAVGAIALMRRRPQGQWA